MPRPRSVPIAAVDVGSNAVRLVVARLYPGGRIRSIRKERYAVRLGHEVFLTRRLDEEMMHKGLVALRDTREILDHYRVKKYRAVATSASREAKNRAAFIREVRLQCGIKLEVIDGDEEARLTREAVLAQFKKRKPPGLIVDLGGGSFEVNFLRNGRLKKSSTLPIGTVRLMESQKIVGGINRVQADRIRRLVLRELTGAYREYPELDGPIVACGGNADALARVAPSENSGRMPAIDVAHLRKVSARMLPMSIAERMRVFGVKRDRAEVMPLAAIVFTTLGDWLGIERIVVPGVGVREGILCDFAKKMKS
jgi:exopolyphosphatase/guanosine-5'-triphosphate,3'-diphosphate pyrophosphatase